MTKELREKQKELYVKSVNLKSMNVYNAPYEKQKEIQKEQDKAYKMWEFYKGLNNAMAERRKQ